MRDERDNREEKWEEWETIDRKKDLLERESDSTFRIEWKIKETNYLNYSHLTIVLTNSNLKYK